MQGPLRQPFPGRALCAAGLLFSFGLSGGAPAKGQQLPATAPTGRLVLATPHARFGDRFQFEVLAWTFHFANSGTRPVTIVQALAIDGTGEVRAPPIPVAPGATVEIEVRQPLAERLGEVAFRYAILTDEPGAPRYRFTLSGFVQSAYDPEKPVLDFGTLDRSLGGTAEATVASREIEHLRIDGVVETPPYLQLAWGIPEKAESVETDFGSSVLLRATLTAGAPQGLLGGLVHLRTNVPHQPLVAVRYVAQVFGDVIPQENPIRLGAIRVGESGTRVVRLHSRTGRAFEVTRAADAGGLLTVVVRACDGSPGPSACHELELRFTPLVPGPVTGSLVVEVAGESAPLPLLYNALAIRPDAVIRQLELAPAAPLDLGPEVQP